MDKTIEKYCPDWNDKLKPMLEDAEKLGAAAERERIRAAVQLIEPDDIAPDYMRGYVDAVKEVLSLLKDGDGK